MPFASISALLGFGFAVSPSVSLAVRLLGILILVVTVLYTRRGMRIGLDVDELSVVVRGPLRSERIPKDQVIGVSTHPWFASRVVDLKIRDGRTLNANLIQGVWTTCDRGKTKDVLSALRQEFGDIS